MDCSTSSLSLPVAVTFLLSLALTPVVRAVARRRGVLAYPDSKRRLHTVPVPLWGGAAVYSAMMVGLVVACCCLTGRRAELVDLAASLLPAAGLACLFGAMDDRWDLNSRLKLVLQLLSVAPIVVSGHYVDHFAVFGWQVNLGWLGVPLTVLWLLGCINALNLIDGVDGLASIIGLSTAMMMGIIAANMGNDHVAVAAVLLAASLAGFLIYNLPPASIFLGDSGSTLIGLTVGILGIQGSMKSSATLCITAPAVIMILPMFDVVMAVLRRKLTGRRFDAADREHIHHRLLDRGLGPWQVLCVIGALCLTTGAAATAATFLRTDALAWTIATILIVLMIRLRLFGHHEFGLLRGAIRRSFASFASLANRFFGKNSENPNLPDEVAPQGLEKDEDIPRVDGAWRSPQTTQADHGRKAA
jgi:UDP-GlcNAc:undecaprenyl-phosphate/decaprenyl-phosphate GlcNAc-1-phosphate transferase